MNSFINKIENTLLEIAETHKIPGSSSSAIIHQWAHAIAYSERMAGLKSNNEEDIIYTALKKAGIFKCRDQFKSNLEHEIPFPQNSNPRFRFIDLFAGIGGFRLALSGVGGFCSFSSEWDKSAQKTYYNNYGELPFGDITSFTAENVSDELLDQLIPDHDILAGGFPCQPFSHAGVSAREAIGKKHGFECQTQGTLFFDIMRIASVKRPKVLFLENVRNLTTHDKGHTFQVIRDSIEELGYDFRYSIIDSSLLVPQRRVRCYMVCFRKDLAVNFEFPKFTGQPKPLRSILEENAAEAYTISDKLWEGHIKRTERNLDRGTGFTAFTADLDKPSNTIVARYGKDGKECLIPQEGKNPRLLTPRECARLQGFPENFWIPNTKTPAYKQFGNSVAVPVVAAIAKKIIEKIK